MKILAALYLVINSHTQMVNVNLAGMTYIKVLPFKCFEVLKQIAVRSIQCMEAANISFRTNVIKMVQFILALQTIKQFQKHRSKSHLAPQK